MGSTDAQTTPIPQPAGIKIDVRGSGPATFGPQSDSLIFLGGRAGKATLYTWSTLTHRLGAIPALEHFYLTSDSPINMTDNLPVMCRLSPDGRRLAVGTDGSRIDVWDTHNWRRIYSFQNGGTSPGSQSSPPPQPPFCASFSPDGTRLAVRFGDTIRVQDLDSHQSLWNIPWIPEITSGIEFLSDHLIVAAKENTLRFLDLDGRKQVSILPFDATLSQQRGFYYPCLFLSPTRKYLAITAGSLAAEAGHTVAVATVYILRLSDKSIVQKISVVGGGAPLVCFYDQDRRVLFNTVDEKGIPAPPNHLRAYQSTLRAYAIDTGKEIGYSRAFKGQCYNLLISPDEKQIALITDHGTAVWPLDRTVTNDVTENL